MAEETEEFKMKPAGRATTLRSANTKHSHTGADSEQIEFNDLAGVMYYSIAYNPAELQGVGSAETQDLTAIGSRLGDFVLVGPPYDLQGITHTGYVSGVGTVTIQLVNNSGATVNLIEGNWNIKVASQGTAIVT